MHAWNAALVVVFVAAIIVVPTGTQAISTPSLAPNIVAVPPDFARASVGGTQLAPSGSARISAADLSTIDLAFALPSRDPADLSYYLREVSTPESPGYDHFLTLAQFDARYGASASSLEAVHAFLVQNSLHEGTVYPGGFVVDATGTTTAVQKAFQIELSWYRLPSGRLAYAPSETPTIPILLSGSVLDVDGLSSVVRPVVDWGWGQNTYQQGVQQQFFGPDFQVPNDLPAVYNSTASHVFGKGETVATVLWDGERCQSYNIFTGACTTYGGEVSAFDPSWITSYWSSYLPSWEPRPNVAGVPVDGAPAPGASAELDATQAYAESTLDLEMAGSMAPGANITEVYTTCDPSSTGPNGPTIAQIDDAFTTAVTNPNNLASLKNVTTISNSWGAPEYGSNAGGGYVFDAVWRNTLIQALGTGITVLASSGDSGNNSVNWPADIGNDTYGMTSVGGITLNVTGTPATQHLTTVTISGTQVIGLYSLPQSNAGSTVTGIHTETSWWFPAGTVNGQSYPAGGTTGGPSQFYSEPSWQSFALAGNSENPSPHRGDADIAGVANNTLVLLNVCALLGSACSSYNKTALISIGGTSIASPEDAGVLAVVAGAVGHRLGFIDPTLYSLGYNQTAGKLSPNPFYDVTLGKNSNYTAQTGWDYPTGWGTLDAKGLVTNWPASIIGPSIVSWTDNPTSIPLGQSMWFNVTATGGTTPYSYAYTNLPTGCTTANTASLSCTPTAAGTYSGVTVTVTDSTSKSVTSTGVTLNVTSSSGPSISSWVANPPSIPLGQITWLNVTATGGTTPYSYAYTGLPAGCASKNLASFTCTPSAAGNFTVTVTVTDSASPANSISTN
ncbi:MAG: hypothetical protein JRN35_10785, partial [Nitrososphaerota archaeon]|nr:hypothetical protein [Nitrososphaerota archaeon]